MALPQEYPKPNIRVLRHLKKCQKAPTYYLKSLKDNRLQLPITRAGFRASIILENLPVTGN